MAGGVGVATRDVFSAGELARLRGFPEIARAELIRYFRVVGLSGRIFPPTALIADKHASCPSGRAYRRRSRGPVSRITVITRGSRSAAHVLGQQASDQRERC